MIDIARGWNEALHPREAGKFAPKAGAKSSGESLSFDGKRGTGYGAKDGDNRVKELQTALNKLGLTDSAGKPLKLDGKLGPKTTAAIKKAQRALGMKADGKVTPEFLKGIKDAAAKDGKKATKKADPSGLAAAKGAAAKKAASPAKRGQSSGLAAAKGQAAKKAAKKAPAMDPSKSSSGRKATAPRTANVRS